MFNMRVQQVLDGRKEVDLRIRRKQRTLKQNRYLHLLLGWFATETGYTVAEAKQLFKQVCEHWFVYRKGDRVFVRSTADLDTKQLTQAIEHFREYSNGVAGIYLPAPNEGDWLREIEYQISKNGYI
jgi:hypothetical protein